jgi:hypothetical protein
MGDCPSRFRSVRLRPLGGPVAGAIAIVLSLFAISNPGNLTGWTVCKLTTLGVEYCLDVWIVPSPQLWQLDSSD